jgi:ribonuclease PH
MMRSDGRQADQARALKITPNYMPTAEGSALIEIGNTKVICTASVEEGVPSFRRGSGKGWITAEYSMLPRATSTRTQREVTRGRLGGRTQEIQRLIGRSLRGATDFNALGERTVMIDCDVIQADGGTRTASITGGWLALALAFRQMLDYKLIKKSPLNEYLAAISVGVVDGAPMLDLCYEEDSRADVDMNVVMTSAGEHVEVQATAEKGSFSRSQLDALLDLAAKGVGELVEAQRAIVTL